MRDLAVLFLHLLATVARLAGPGGARSVLAESVLVKQQVLILIALFMSICASAHAGELRGIIIDRADETPLAARLYIHDSRGESFFAKSADRDGSAVAYRKQRSPESFEVHTSLSAHPFTVELPVGRYTLTVERGKEYLPITKTVQIGAEPTEIEIRLRRWVKMAEFGWYSGETHVHRSMQELPNLLVAEDLNVALPLTYWVTVADTPPSQVCLSFIPSGRKRLNSHRR